MIVVDASAALELLLQGPHGRAVADRVLAPDAALHAPQLIDLEIAQVLRRLVRRREVTGQRAEQAFEDLADLPLTRHPHQFLLPLVWAMRDNASAYDAAYLALADVLDAPLVTCDRALANLPGSRAEVVVIE